MRNYYRPIVRTGLDRPDDAFTLAGGWCWFTQVAVHQRGQQMAIVPAADAPAKVLTQLTVPRPAVAGMKMDAPRIMGILNVTPDSFSDGGQFLDPAQAADHVAKMVISGVDIIDIGGESTRPGAAEVSVPDEVKRTAPVIAGLINDVAALTFDPALGQVAAAHDLPVCLMHAQGDPETMQDDPRYDDVLLDVYDYLEARINAAMDMGVARDQIIIDPGIGFGKTVDHILALMRGLSLFHALGRPVLLGASRKRFIGAIGGGQDASDRVAGSIAVALEGLRQGVQITRVHDTFETKQAFDLQLAMNER